VTGLALFFVLLSEVCTVAGQIFLKRAMNESANHARQKLIGNLIAGIAVLALGFFLWLGLLARFDLSYLYPFEGLNRVVLLAGTWFFLNEKLTWSLGLGVLLISAGVFLVASS
jgi:drug/metabolite transporter (DMT)-like permease